MRLSRPCRAAPPSADINGCDGNLANSDLAKIVALQKPRILRMN